MKRNDAAFWRRAPNHEVMLIGLWDEPAGAERVTQWVPDGAASGVCSAV